MIDRSNLRINSLIRDRGRCADIHGARYILLASFQCHRTSKGLELGYSMDETNLSADYDIFRICPSEDK
jgi:hypothetical protein